VCALIAALAVANAAFEKTQARGAANLSQAELRPIGDYMRHEIASGKIPGAIVLVQQHGRPVYFERFGFRDVAARLPMTDDTIFRLYSMSKAITSVAAMMLVDDGKLSLDDPVGKYIPAFADVKVGVEKPHKTGKPALTLEPLKHPITILDLLRHTSGLTYGFYGVLSENSTRRPTSTPAISTTPSLSRAWPNCRSPSSPGRCGITVIPPMCSAG
jgi:CubicO group peptidase (beta-lactamase class C family)